MVETLTIDARRYDPLAEVRVKFRLRTSRGTLVVGPFVASLQNTAGRRRATVPADPGRSLRLLHLYMTGVDAEALRELEGMSNRSENRRMVDALKTVLPHPASAAVLVDCPVPEVRTAVLSKVFADAGLSELDGLDNLDQRWVDEIRSVYLGDTWNWRHPTWATRDYTRQRQMLAWIDRHGGEGGLDLALVKERLNVADPELYFLLSTDVSKYLQRRAGSWAPLEFVHTARQAHDHARWFTPSRQVPAVPALR